MKFLNRVKSAFNTFLNYQHQIDSVFSATVNNRLLIEQSLILQGKGLALQNVQRAFVNDIKQYEFKVFSQFGEDGIIQHLIREAQISEEEKTFVEFGVQDYSESNTRFLLMNDNWRGLIFDGDADNINLVKSQGLYWRHELTAECQWINRDNINQLIEAAGFNGSLGILSVDIDGNDYWVWECISVVNPIIVVVEWNSVFGKDLAITVPYDANFKRENAHHSNLYWGASIAAFYQLGLKKGYSLVGSNSAGNNLFFVQTGRLGRMQAIDADKAYVESRFRESRNVQGNLNYISGKKRLDAIAEMEVVDLKDGKLKAIQDLSTV